MTLVLALLVALVATLLPTSAAVGDDETTGPYADRVGDGLILSRIDVDDAMGHLRHLVNEIGPRLGGTPAENEAANYIRGVLDSYGYETWLQPFAASNKLVGHVMVTGEPLPYGRKLQTGVAQNGRMTQGELVTGELAWANTGMTVEEFPAGVAGKIVVMENASTNANRNVQVGNAVTLGAAGVILRRPQATPFDPALTTVVTIPVLGVGGGQGTHLRERAEAGSNVVSIESSLLTGLTAYNVFGRKAPTHPRPSHEQPRIAMISGHYDSVRGAPGANDDASGTILTLELARVLADLPTTEEVRFAFWGAEEQGLIGSNYYVNNAGDAELGRYIGLWQNDMVATSWEPADRYNLLSVNGQHNTVTLSVEAAANRINLGHHVIGPIVRGGSDHVPFHNRGIAAANHSWRPLSGPGNLEPPYHTPEDTIEFNISPERWEISMSMIGTAVYSQVRPRFDAAEAELDALVADGGITPSLEAKIRHALDMAELWLENPRQKGPALSHLARAIHLLEWQADVVDRTGKPQGDAAGLRALADFIAGLEDFLR